MYKGGFGGDWRYLGPQDNKLAIDTIDTIDTIDDMDPEDAKVYWENKQKSYIVMMETMIKEYINESKSIEEYKQDFRPEGGLGVDATILFKILEKYKDDINNNSWKPCTDLLRSYIYLIGLLEEEYNKEEKGGKKYKRKINPKNKSKIKHRNSKTKKSTKKSKACKCNSCRCNPCKCTKKRSKKGSRPRKKPRKKH